METAAREAPFLLTIPNRRIVTKSPKISAQSPGADTSVTIGKPSYRFPPFANNPASTWSSGIDCADVDGPRNPPYMLVGAIRTEIAARTNVEVECAVGSEARANQQDVV
jgi:hypothetical protein